VLHTPTGRRYKSQSPVLQTYRRVLQIPLRLTACCKCPEPPLQTVAGLQKTVLGACYMRRRRLLHAEVASATSDGNACYILRGAPLQAAAASAHPAVASAKISSCSCCYNRCCRLLLVAAAAATYYNGQLLDCYSLHVAAAAATISGGRCYILRRLLQSVPAVAAATYILWRLLLQSAATGLLHAPCATSRTSMLQGGRLRYYARPLKVLRWCYELPAAVLQAWSTRARSLTGNIRRGAVGRW
jgi:hypothetical protein